jgi:hypothetical protein
VKELASYLNDHLAGSVGALELLEHWAKLHEGRLLGHFFMDIEAEIRADQEKLREAMRSLCIEESSVRKAAAWFAEKAGRARVMIADDESRSLGLVMTFEGLIMGIAGKKLMWRALAAANLAQLDGYDFDELQCRAEEQIERIEAERMRAILEAFTGTHSLH